MINFSNNRSQLIPSFARSYRSGYKGSKQNDIKRKRKGSYLNNELNTSQSHCHQLGKNQQGFPRAELQLLPTSSESNFASGSSDMRQSTLEQTDSVGQVEEAKRLSQRYVYNIFSMIPRRNVTQFTSSLTFNILNQFTIQVSSRWCFIP